MNSVETKKIDRQVQMWALIGPMIALLSSSLILFKAPSHATYLIIGLLIGLPACWWAKWRGLAVSFGILAALFVFNYSGIPAGQKFWHLGMVLSLFICFAVTSLSLLEAESVLDLPETDQEQQNKMLALQKVHEEQLVELNNYKDLLDVARQDVIANQKELEALRLENTATVLNYNKLEEKHIDISHRFSSQQDQFTKARQEMQYFQDRLQSMHGELQTAKNELVATRRQNEELLQEVSRTREVGEVYAKAHEDHLVHEAQVHEMSDRIQTLLKEKEHLQATLTKTQNDLTDLRQESITYHNEKEQTRRELVNLAGEKDALSKEIKDIQSKASQVQHEMQKLSSEKATIDSTISQIQASLQKAQQDNQKIFAEKEALNKSYNDIQSKFAQVQQDMQKANIENATLETTLSQLQTKLQKSEEDCQKLVVEKEALNNDKNEVYSKVSQVQLEIQKINSEKVALDTALSQLQLNLQKSQATAVQAQQETQKAAAENEMLHSQINALQTELDHMKDQHKQRTNDYAELNSQLINLQNKADLLSVEKETSLQELQTLRAERDALGKDVQEKGHSFEGVTSEASAWRQAEAKYNQLQGQFAEKSGVLDSTRRELFLTQEKLLQLQKEIEESETYTINETEAALTQQLIQMEKQSKNEVVEYQKEIAALHEIISTLVKDK